MFLQIFTHPKLATLQREVCPLQGNQATEVKGLKSSQHTNPEEKGQPQGVRKILSPEGPPSCNCPPRRAVWT